MASILKHLRSSTADKRPTASGLADGQIAINTASGTPALFFKNSAGGIVKVGPAHTGTSAPNVSPAGSAGNSTGEFWIDENLTTRGLKYYDGATFINLTPSGTSTTVGLVELATDAETQTGTDATRAVTPSGLQSKISDSTSTTSSTTIASSTAVKSAYDLANAALPKAGGTLTGELLISPSGSLVFEGSSDDSFETTIAVTNPTADRTITFPNVTGNVVTTGDSGTVTSTMIADGTIVDADINAAAAITHSKLANITAGSVLLGNASNVPTATALSGDVTVNSSGVTAISAGVIVNADINASAAIVDTKLDTISTADKVSLSALNIDGATDIGGALENGDLFVVDDGAGGTNRKAQAFRMAQLTYSGVTGDITVASGGTAAISAGVIVNADVNASAAIAGTKISPDFGSQNVTTTGTSTAASFIPTSSTVPTNGVYLPSANNVAISTNGTGRLFVDASGNVGINKSGLSQTFHVKSASGGTTSRFENLSSGNFLDFYETTGNTRMGYIGHLNATDMYIHNDKAGPLVFDTNNLERLRITSTGFVGIGTSSPSYTLDAAGTFRSTGIARLGTGQTTTLAYIGDPDTSGTRYISFSRASALTNIVNIQGTNAGVGPADIALQAGGGNVGVGTSSPTGTLTVYDSGNQIVVNAPTSSNSNITFAENSTTKWVAGYVPSISAFRFSNGSSDILALTNTGRVGVGTTSPGALFHVRQNDAVGPTIQLENNAQSVYINNWGSTGGGGNRTNRLEVNASATGYAAAICAASQIELHVGGVNNEKARIDSSGRLLVGTSSSSAGTRAVFQGQSSGAGSAAQIHLQRDQAAASIGTGQPLGIINFCDNAANVFATVTGETDGAAGTSDYPGRLVFAVTRDGQSAPSIAMYLFNTGAMDHYSNWAGGWGLKTQNDGNNSDRYGLRVLCGTYAATGTNYAVSIEDGNGDNQGYITFTGGTVTYGAFTAHHPCILPDADNEAGYPYGTLLEIINIEYTQKDGKDTERGILYNVRKTQAANSRAVLGAYGSSMNGGPGGETNRHQALVLGDGHILCNNSGGNIKVGDGICSSATPGIGQKATATPSMAIGIAQEDVTFADDEEVKLVAVQYGVRQFIPWGD